MDALYERNVEIDDLLQIWEWCSRLLHIRWQRRPKLRNPCYLGLAVALSDDREVKPMQLLKSFKKFPRPLIGPDEVETFWEVQPAALLELCVGAYTKSAPLAQALTDLRNPFRNNPKLDELAKKMRCRQKRFGDDWWTDGHHPEREYRLLVKKMKPLCEALRVFMVEEHSAVSEMAVEVLALGWQKGEVPVSCLIRKTPEKLLNKATRIKLWRAGRTVLDRDLPDNELLTALQDAIYRELSPSITASVEAQGYNVEDLVCDIIGYDLIKTREELAS
jgi:hypothetical protein